MSDTSSYSPKVYKTWDSIKLKITEKGCKWLEPKEGLSEDAITWAEDFAYHLTNDDSLKQLTTSQLRKFFGEIKTIKAMGFENNRGRFRMLKTQIAYAVGRDKKNGENKTKILHYYEAFSVLINDACVNDKTTFKNFVSLNEAVVAYHREKGGKES